MTVMECPKCGAPVEMTGDEVVCGYCGTKFARPKPQAQERVIERVVIQQPVATPRYTPPAKTASPLGALIGTLVILGIIGFVIYYFLFSGGAGGNLGSISKIGQNLSNYVMGNVVVMPKDNESAPDLLVRSEDLNAEKAYVTAISGADHSVLWKGPMLSKDASHSAPILAGDQLVYIIDGSTLMGLDNKTGALKWQVSLANSLPITCRDTCIEMIGSRLVVLTRDGTLQSYDALTGKPAWSQRLNSTPSGILNANDRVAVVDKTEQGSGDGVILLFDPATGAVQKLQPTCTIEGSKTGVNTSDAVTTSPDGKSLIILYSWTNICIQRWDVGTNKASWSTLGTQQNLALHFPSSATRLVTANSVFLTGDPGRTGWVAVVDMQSGKLQVFEQDKRYQLTLQAASGNMLIVSAVPNFDTETTELWGLDMSTGKRNWQYVLKAKGIFSGWETHLTGGGLALFQCVDNDPQCTFEVLDPQTGVSSGQAKIDNPSSHARLDASTWTSQQGLITLSGKLISLDLAKRTLAYSWP